MGVTPLWLAAWKGHEDVVKGLFSDPKIDPKHTIIVQHPMVSSSFTII